jgi:hypothetical protein
MLVGRGSSFRLWQNFTNCPLPNNYLLNVPEELTDLIPNPEKLGEINKIY